VNRLDEFKPVVPLVLDPIEKINECVVDVVTIGALRSVLADWLLDAKAESRGLLKSMLATSTNQTEKRAPPFVDVTVIVVAPGWLFFAYHISAEFPPTESLEFTPAET